MSIGPATKKLFVKCVKQQKREERRNRKKRVVTKTTGYTVPLDRPITLDDLTNPNKND